MSGTRIGGQRAAVTNKQRYGDGFYADIGAKGGRNGKGQGYKGGFASDKVGQDGLTGPERAKIAGYKGGRISRRGVSTKGGEE